MLVCELGRERAEEPSGQEHGLCVQIPRLLLHDPEQMTYTSSPGFPHL